MLMGCNAMANLSLSAGVLRLDPALTLTSLAAVIIFESRFLDRMVWLFEVTCLQSGSSTFNGVCLP